MKYILLLLLSLLIGAVPAPSGSSSFEFNLGSKEDLLTQKVEMYKQLKFSKRKSLYIVDKKMMKKRDQLVHAPIKDLTGMEEQVSHFFNDLQVNEHFLSTDFQNNFSKDYNSDLTFGNKLKLLPNKSSFEKKFEMVRNAKDYFIFITMLLQCDDSTIPFMDEMIAAAKRGVKVYIISESFFNTGKFKCNDKFKNIENITFLESRGAVKKLVGINFQHEKITIKDGEEAIVDGANMIDIETDADGFNDLYRDTGIHVQGPMVTDILDDFNRMWNYISHKDKSIKGTESPFTSLVRERKEAEYASGARKYEIAENLTGNEQACRYIIHGPHSSGDRDVARSYITHINQAKEYIFASTQRRTIPKRLRKKKLTDQVFKSLYQAAQRDVHVDFMINYFRTPFMIKSPNNQGGDKSFLSFMLNLQDDLTLKGVLRRALRRMRKAGGNNFKIWSYFQYYHSKLLFLDNIVSGVGSYNINNVSTESSMENIIYCYDRDLAKQYLEMLKLDLINSVPLWKFKQ